MESDLFIKAAPKMNLMSKRCLHKLFDKMMNAKSKITDIPVKIERNNQTDLVDDNVRQILLKHQNVYYFPKSIQAVILSESQNLTRVDFVIPGIVDRKISISFFHTYPYFDVEKYLPSILLMYTMFCDMSDAKCSHTLDVYIFLTAEKKELPEEGGLIQTKNANSGFSGICAKNGEIVLFREEEWMKVLIHESIHNLGLDFAFSDQSGFEREISRIFPVRIKNPEWNEMYTEVWAEIINVALIALSYCDPFPGFESFSLYFQGLIQLEVVYSILQVAKILTYYNTSYDDLYKREKYWNQETHVFEYYVLKTILIANWTEFLCWVYEQNNDLVKFCYFNSADNHMKKESLARCVTNCFEKTNFRHLMREVHRLKEYETLGNSLRMSVCEL